jgi:hypothetical protein
MRLRSIAAVLGAAVAGGLGVGGAIILSGTASPESDCVASRAEALLSNRIVAPSQSYRRDNPGEYAKVRAYLDGGARPTGVVTHMGLHLLYLEDACRGLTTTTTTTTTTTPPPPPPPPSDIFVTANGNDSNPCTQASPCRSFNRAYQVASCGSVVGIGPGSYPTQGITERAALSGCSQHVVFSAQPGATIPQLWFGSNIGGASSDAPDAVTIRGLKWTHGIYLWGDATNILIENGDGGGIIVEGASNVTIRGNDFGPCSSSGPGNCERVFFLDPPGQQTTNNILFERNVVHDYLLNAEGDHWACSYNRGAQVTLRLNRYYNCDTMAMTLIDPRGWVIENNWFGDTCCYGGIRGQGGTSRETSIAPYGNAGTVLIRFNSFGPGQTVIHYGQNLPGWKLVGNIFGSNASCIPAAPYSYNLMVGGVTCSSSDRQIGALPYVNSSGGANGNYHLSGPSLADGFVPGSAPDSNLATDYDGQPRNAPRDAGSDER